MYIYIYIYIYMYIYKYVYIYIYIYTSVVLCIQMHRVLGTSHVASPHLGFRSAVCRRCFVLMVCLVFVFPSHMIRHQRTVCILFTRQIEQRSRQVANQKGFLANQNGVLANQPGIVASQNCALASQNVCNLTYQRGILASPY